MYDVAMTFLLGVPPLAEYAYEDPYDSNDHGLEWRHGIPVPLFQVLSQVNSWRVGSQARLDDWQTLERLVVGWKPLCDGLDEASATDIANAERIVIEEGWRHVVLIYIYMVYYRIFYYLSRLQTKLLGYMQGLIS
jgi:hypothetical protein